MVVCTQHSKTLMMQRLYVASSDVLKLDLCTFQLAVDRRLVHWFGKILSDPIRFITLQSMAKRFASFHR
jgi:hypothetical protein